MNMKKTQLLLTGFMTGVLAVAGMSMMVPHRVSSGVYGDVNGDGWVDIADVNEVINVILTQPTQPVEPPATMTFTIGDVSFSMVTVEGGTFTMGATAEQLEDAYEDELPTHRVTLSRFSIGQTEVTQELWQAVMNFNPSRFTSNGQHPVEQVSWDDCQTFLTRLNSLTGKQFRLPTEAEWEFAARGGNKAKRRLYAGSNTLGEVAWYDVNSYLIDENSPNYGTHAVATKAPNELGLYDMSGNVWEWCHDWFDDYTSTSQTDPTGPTDPPSPAYPYRVHRGGAWDFDAVDCRVSVRGCSNQSSSSHDIGLRLALSI